MGCQSSSYSSDKSILFLMVTILAPGRRIDSDGTLDILLDVPQGTATLPSNFDLQVTSSDSRYLISFVRRSDDTIHVPPTLGSFIVADIDGTVVNTHLIRIQRPASLMENTGPFKITASITTDSIIKFSDTTTVTFNASQRGELTGLQRGSASAMGLLLLSLAMVIYVAYRMVKLKYGIFIISVTIALVGIGLILSDDELEE